MLPVTEQLSQGEIQCALSSLESSELCCTLKILCRALKNGSA